MDRAADGAKRWAKDSGQIMKQQCRLDSRGKRQVRVRGTFDTPLVSAWPVDALSDQWAVTKKGSRVRRKFLNLQDLDA